MLKRFGCILILQFTLPLGLAAQAGSSMGASSIPAAGNQLGPTARDILAQHHVPLTKDGLMSALHNAITKSERWPPGSLRAWESRMRFPASRR